MEPWLSVGLTLQKTDGMQTQFFITSRLTRETTRVLVYYGVVQCLFLRGRLRLSYCF